MPVRIPVVEMIEIGAGGGSIASVDRLGRLVVGPESAGSEPGPAAFGAGGEAPTVTDADIVLGYIVPDRFAEGQIAVDADASRYAIDASIGQSLQLKSKPAADGISRIVGESMASAARMHAVESGKDLGARTMIAFGGNGGLHACRVARSAGVQRILVPVHPGVGSAIGFLSAPVSVETVRSRYSRLQTLDIAATNAFLDAMAEEVRTVVAQGAPEARILVTKAAFMRYSGQGHEIEIPLPDRPMHHDDIDWLTRQFETEYSQQFSRPVPGMHIEILNWSVRASTGNPEIVARPKEPATRQLAPTERTTIWCDVAGEPREAALIDRAELVPGHCLDGPALVTEPQTTTLVGADFALCVDSAGNLVLTRNSAEVST